MSSSKKWREQKISQGLCGTCGKTPHIENQKECKGCRKRRRNRQKSEYHSGEHSKTKKSLKDRRAKFKKKGLCTNCGKEQPSNNLLTCEHCIAIQKKRSDALKNQVYDHYGGYKCSCCGESIKEFLTLDHIDNDGAEHRKGLGNSGSGRGLYLWIIKNGFPKMFQVLCMNCNWGKRMNNGICPHKSIH